MFINIYVHIRNEILNKGNKVEKKLTRIFSMITGTC